MIDLGLERWSHWRPARRTLTPPAPGLPAPLVRWFRRRLSEWAADRSRRFPWRETRDPYRVLVAELLLHQTFARKVVPVYERLVERYPSPPRSRPRHPAPLGQPAPRPPRGGAAS